VVTRSPGLAAGCNARLAASGASRRVQRAISPLSARLTGPEVTTWAHCERGSH
jgi:hypothetical protein